MTKRQGDRAFPWLQFVVAILVTGYGLWAAIELYGGYNYINRMEGRDPERGVRVWLNVTVPLFAWWSVAVLALTLIAREGRRTWRRPGIVPGMAVVLFMARNVVESTVRLLRWKGSASLPFWWVCGMVTPSPGVLVTISHSAGFAVAATWLALRAGGWWHAAPTWTERAGRALGWYWIAVCVIDPFYLSLV